MKISLIIIFVLINCTLGAKILFLFGGGNYSHKTGIWPLVIALAEKGHKITFMSSTVKQPRTHPNINDLAPKGLQDSSKQIYSVDRIEARAKYEERKLYETYDAASINVCKVILGDPDLDNLFENESFDLAIINVIYGECGLLIANHFGVKYILSSSTFPLPWLGSIFGVPSEASWLPDMSSSFTFPMGLVERMINVYYYYQMSRREEWVVEEFDKLMKQKFKKENAPSFREMEKNASLVFVNGHHTLDFPRSLPPMFIQIGGMSGWEPAGELPKEFQEYMDGAEEGVVLITFGSTMDLSTMPLKYRTMFFNMMNKFNKVRFLWRWTGDLPKDQPQNLKASKWLPQKEILQHPKLKAFVTHCGVNGIIEATYYGVPLLAMPFFGDQDFSAYRIVAQEIGLLLESRGLNQEIIDSTFEEILTNPKYKKNMVAKSKMFKDRPQSPTELAVYWTEYVLRHDDLSSLKSPAMHQSFITRSLCDVYIMFVVIFAILPLIILYMLVALVKKMLGK